MFKKKSRTKRRGLKRRGNKQKMRKPKPLLGLNPAVQNVQTAKMVETWDRGIVASNAAYMNTIEITRFPRAMAMAKLFKFYRAKRVIYEYRPDQNTFQGGAGQVAIPYAYYIMNRSGANSSGQAINQYLASGARPIKFTQKILVSYKPNTVHIADVVMTQLQGQNISIGRTPIYDAWYATDGLANPPAYTGSITAIGVPGPTQPAISLSVVQYFGHDIIFEQTQGAEADIGSLTVTVEWEFKVPNFQAITPS